MARTEGAPAVLISNETHIPASMCPGTRQAIRKAPVRSVTNVNDADCPGGMPTAGAGVAASGKASRLDWAPSTTPHEWRIGLVFRQLTWTVQLTGTTICNLPLPSPSKLNPFRLGPEPVSRLRVTTRPAASSIRIAFETSGVAVADGDPIAAGMTTG